jgi:hypothetical protein
MHIHRAPPRSLGSIVAAIAVVVTFAAAVTALSTPGAARAIDGPVSADDPPIRPPSGAVRERLRIGTTAQGRPMVARRYGDPTGVVVLIAAALHGDEVSGKQITRAVERAARRGRIPKGVDLWVLPDANPDGSAAGTRQNARGVDLNRNFPTLWRPLRCPGSYCSGPSAASEPETRALMDFMLLTRPRVAVWWHATGTVVDAARTGVADPDVLRAYADEAGYPIAAVPCGSTTVCTGNATQFGNAGITGATHFVVELPTNGQNLSGATVRRHVRALWAAVDAAR